MRVIYEQDAELKARGVSEPFKANKHDSGFDVVAPQDIKIPPRSRALVYMGVKFAPKLPWWALPLTLLGLGVEVQVRPKSGRSKAGVDIAFGTGDEGYRNYYSAVVVNNTSKALEIRAGEKMCQVVFAPVFNRVKLVEGKVSVDTDRGLGGFGSSGLKK